MGRGVYVIDMVYQFICAIEAEMGSPLNAVTSYHSKDTTSMLTRVESDENLQYAVTAEFDIEDKEADNFLLRKTIKLSSQSKAIQKQVLG